MQKINIFLVLLLSSVLSVKSQNMNSLYEYIIEDGYKNLNKNDSLNYIFGLNDCLNGSFMAYDLKIDNNRILNRIPEVNSDHRYSSVLVLSAPELQKNLIFIPVSYYDVKYVDDNEDINLIYQGTISYYFKYSKDLEKYVYIKKIEQ